MSVNKIILEWITAVLRKMFSKMFKISLSSIYKISYKRVAAAFMIYYVDTVAWRWGRNSIGNKTAFFHGIGNGGGNYV